jgi:hypothetical protein
MLLSTNRYTPGSGWDIPLDASLDSKNTLLLIFGASDAEALRHGLTDLYQAYPLSVLHGCSTSGEIYGTVIQDGTLVVAVLKFAHTRLSIAHCQIIDGHHSFQAASFIAKALAAPDLKAIFVLSDGLSTNGSELAKGFSQNLSPEIVITGGLAGDGDRFKQTWVLIDKQPKSHCVAAVGLYGDHLGIACSSGGGWDVLGVEREVTRSDGNVLYTLDGRPALSLYKDYLGDRTAGLPATGLLFPLAICNALEEDGLTIRTILSVNEFEQSMTFAGDIPQGEIVCLMRANLDRLIGGSANAVTHLAIDCPQYTDSLTVAISCVGRRMVLSQRAEEELEAVLDGLTTASKLVGFYSYGELSPLKSGRCDLHNQTMTLTSFWEK